MISEDSDQTVDAQAGSTSLIIHFVMCWLIFNCRNYTGEGHTSNRPKPTAPICV